MKPAIAKQILLDRMESLSEERWCAGWMSGLEYELWADFDTILLALAEEAGGWWVWLAGANGVTFLPLPEWRKMFEEHIAEKTRRGEPIRDPHPKTHAG